MSEAVKQSWKVKGWQMDATDRRVLIHKGGHTIEVGYNHISSLEWRKWFSKGRIAGGIVLIVLGVMFAPLLAFASFPWMGGYFAAIGALGVLAIIGGVLLIVFSRKRKLIIYAAGREPIKLSAGRGDVEQLMNYIREKINP